uniref:NADH:ubiquinone oxidoreductase intermediate-associated protein 30 domain-containing protein n=1 Tax=Calcidiscus leptoporus TaxID=127549 RepID=A0A7S0IYF5_9EUKA|mmetsp:Transcript_2969/g.6723  ORF Transcript_2969/g.6723 Transcript_2969/m.6723 type:complete len:219 (+) Transcript_2969:19-675(+)
MMFDLAAVLVATFVPSGSEIPLVSFASGSDPAVTHTWKALNDPVMGGQSTSRVAVENSVLNFTGTCAIVPSLKAPGFITAVTGNGFFAHETFVDVSSCKGLTIVAKDFASYKGYRISFGTAKPIGGKFFAEGYKANLSPTVGAFGAARVPFTAFTDFWDDATGDPIHTCAEDASYCPDQKTLRNMKTMSIWAEGVQGAVHLEVKTIAGYGCSAAAQHA